MVELKINTIGDGGSLNIPTLDWASETETHILRRKGHTDLNEHTFK